MDHGPCYTHLKALQKAPLRLIALRNISATARQIAELRDYVSTLIHPPMLPPPDISLINISQTVLTEPVFDPLDVVHLSVLKYYIVLLSQFIQKDFALLNGSLGAGNKKWNQKVKMWSEWTTIEHWFGFTRSARVPEGGWHGRVMAQLWTQVHKRAKQMKKDGEPEELKGKSLMKGLKMLWKLRHVIGFRSTGKVEISAACRHEQSAVEWPGVG